MRRKTPATGILLLLLVSTVSPLTMGLTVSQDESMILSDVEYTSIPYTSDSTISQTVILYQYLNPQPTMMLDNGLMDSAWPMKCHDLQHTSRSPYVSNDGGGLEKWRFRCGDWMEASAVIDNEGIIYFGNFDRYLYALYPNGSLKWKYKTDGWIWSTPALAEDGTIYVGSWDAHKLHAVYPNGTRKWTVGLGAVTTSSPAIAPDGTIYLSTMANEPPSSNSLVAVNPNGTIKWWYRTGDVMVSEPAIGDDGTVYVGSQDTYFYAINPNGTLKWRFKTGDWVSASPAIADDGTVYISSFDGWLYALNPDNGSLIWKYTDGGDEGSPAIGPDGIIYLGNSRLRAIYPDGTLKYSVDIGPNIDFPSPALSADGILYIGTAKSIFAVNSSDGSVLWQKQIANDYVDSSPIIGSDGTLYIGSSSHTLISNGYWLEVGYLHAFGPVESNLPPAIPVIGGKPKGAAGESQVYSFKSDDPQKNPVSFYIDWGDGNSTEWSGGGAPPKVLDECASGETVYFKHTYAEQGTYTIRAKARDTLGEESDWGTLIVRMPKSYNVGLGWQWLQHHFPVITRLLTVLLPYLA